MILGSVSVDDRVVTTHRDSYELETITVVSVRRPALGAGVMAAVGAGAFALAFGDLLYASEIIGLAAIGASMLGVGIWLGELKLLSRDLSQSDLSGVIFGGYRHLNGMRRQIAMRLRDIKAAEKTMVGRRLLAEGQS